MSSDNELVNAVRALIKGDFPVELRQINCSNNVDVCSRTCRDLYAEIAFTKSFRPDFSLELLHNMTIRDEILIGCGDSVPSIAGMTHLIRMMSVDFALADGKYLEFAMVPKILPTVVHQMVMDAELGQSIAGCHRNVPVMLSAYVERSNHISLQDILPVLTTAAPPIWAMISYDFGSYRELFTESEYEIIMSSDFIQYSFTVGDVDVSVEIDSETNSFNVVIEPAVTKLKTNLYRKTSAHHLVSSAKTIAQNSVISLPYQPKRVVDVINKIHNLIVIGKAK